MIFLDFLDFTNFACAIPIGVSFWALPSQSQDTHKFQGLVSEAICVGYIPGKSSADLVEPDSKCEFVCV